MKSVGIASRDRIFKSVFRYTVFTSDFLWFTVCGNLTPNPNLTCSSIVEVNLALVRCRA